MTPITTPIPDSQLGPLIVRGTNWAPNWAGLSPNWAHRTTVTDGGVVERLMIRGSLGANVEI